MDTRTIDGNALSRKLREALKDRVARMAVRPHLVVILVGADPASQVYVRNKTRACEEVGLASTQLTMDATTTEADLLAKIRELNADPGVHGILVQLPLPKHIAAQKVIESIAPEKDVDGFTNPNVGALFTGSARFVPCTPAGIMAMLDAEGVNPWGKHAVVVGASNIVGKPIAMLLLQKGATVTICNSKTPDLGAMTRQADILVVAIGKPRLVTREMLKPGAVVIDVGINRLPDGKLAGDVDFAGAQGVASRITPVPGGVGPMTITMLIANTTEAAERSSHARAQ